MARVMPHAPAAQRPRKNAEALSRLKARIAEAIHVHVLQALALTQLQIELSRRMCEAGQDAEAIAELDVAAQQIQDAASALQQIMEELGVPPDVIAAAGRSPGLVTEGSAATPNG